MSVFLTGAIIAEDFVGTNDLASGKIALDLLKRYAAGERVFSGIDSQDGAFDFEGADLSFATFSNCFFYASFKGAKLVGTRFDCNVKTCDFSGADLTNADFRGAAICGAIFTGAKLDGADFEDAFWHGYDFKKGELPPS